MTGVQTCALPICNGELTKALNVKVAAYTASAKEKIEKAGGKAEVM